MPQWRYISRRGPRPYRAGHAQVSARRLLSPAGEMSFDEALDASSAYPCHSSCPASRRDEKSIPCADAGVRAQACLDEARARKVRGLPLTMFVEPPHHVAMKYTWSGKGLRVGASIAR